MSTKLRSKHRRGGAIALTLGLILATAGCGSSSSDSSSSSTSSKHAAATTTTATPVDAKLASFCSTYLDIDAKASTGDTESPAGVKALAAAVKDDVAALTSDAPSALSSAVATLKGAVAKAAEGKPEAFGDPGFQMASAKAEAYLHDHCGYQTVDVKGIDYAFEGIPKTLKAGKTSFEFVNATTHNEDHVAIIVREKPGVDLKPLELLKGGQADVMKKAEVAAGVFAPAGQTNAGLVNLTPGNYVVFCPISVGGKDTGEPHFLKGMVASFQVK